MKLIWLSVDPVAPTGYGIVTRNLTPRIQAEGHTITIATKHVLTGNRKWNGMDVMIGTDIGLLNRMVEKEGIDYIVSLLDNHTLGDKIPSKWVSYCPFDTQKVPTSIHRYFPFIKLLIALTKHGQSEMDKIGYKSMYAPHGVDTSVFYPDEATRIKARKNIEWDDNFIIGAVGVNYPDDRKNYETLIKAFKVFHDRHKDARLYIAANMVDDRSAYPLPMIVESLGLTELVAWGNEDEYMKGKVTDEKMANRYRMFDILCMPTKGEGFGLPMIEAQACGTPVVATNASTCPELVKAGWLIDVGPNDWEWFNKEWRPSVSTQNVVKALEKAYKAWRSGRICIVAAKGMHYIRKYYNWDYVFNEYWKPILAEMERLNTGVNPYPNYPRLYEIFKGRIAMGDCKEWCKKECPGEGLANLPGETAKERNILQRSYPVRPDVKGQLNVDTDCPMHGWLAKGFVKGVKDLWTELWGYPRIREFMNCPSGTADGAKLYLALEHIEPKFDDEYTWAMQSKYHTVHPDLTPYIDGAKSVLDVGCGNGKIVKELRKKGIEAVGVEVNEHYQNTNLWIFAGDAEDLDFQDNSYDVVLSVDVLEHLENPIKALQEMFRVSRGKVIAFITPVECGEFWQDPTHKVEWDMERWKREVSEFGEIKQVVKPFGLVAEKVSKCQIK